MHGTHPGICVSSSYPTSQVPMGRRTPGDTRKIDKSVHGDTLQPSPETVGSHLGLRGRVVAYGQLPPSNLVIFLEMSGLEIPQFLLLPQLPAFLLPVQQTERYQNYIQPSPVISQSKNISRLCNL